MSKVNTPETQIEKQLCQLPPPQSSPLGPPDHNTFLPAVKQTTVLKDKSWPQIRNSFPITRANELPYRPFVALSHGNGFKQFLSLPEIHGMLGGKPLNSVCIPIQSTTK